MPAGDGQLHLQQKLLDLYPNLIIALLLLLTVSVTDIMRKKLFTSRLVKNYLHSMSQEHLNILAEIAIEQDFPCKLDFATITEYYVSTKAHMIKF